MKTVEAGTRIQLKNILFATDFSTAASDAIPYAAELARHFGSKVYALYVRPPHMYATAPPESWPALTDAVELLALEQKKALLASFPGIDREAIIDEGAVWPAIASELEKNKIDLIVLGTRGRTGIGKALFGSEAEEILREAPCAVLTVGPHSDSKRLQGGKISEILYATDLSPESLAAAPYAISLAQEFQARLTLLHVIEERKASDLIATEQLVFAALRRMQALIPADAKFWCEPGCVVKQGAAAEKILEVAAQNHADMIVLGIHPRKGIPAIVTHLPIATAHKILSQATCPVLTVRS